MIDYTKIKKQCPLAWAEFISKNNGLELSESGQLATWYDTGLRLEGHVFNDRDLFDYFDSVGIIVNITHATPHFGDSFYFVIHTNSIDKLSDVEDAFKPFATRTEAEASAFTRAFHIREGKLK